MEWNFSPEEDPARAQAEAFQQIARQLKRLADSKEPVTGVSGRIELDNLNEAGGFNSTIDTEGRFRPEPGAPKFADDESQQPD